MSLSIESALEKYTHGGFAYPVDVLEEQEALALRKAFEAAEAELADDAEKLSLLKNYPNFLLPEFDSLTRNPRIIEVVANILGPDLLVWNASLFIKEAHSPQFISWHQDLAYWGLDDAQEVTAWVALSPSTIESGCMRFKPGSHTKQLVPHVDTYNPNSLLSRGQVISVEVNEADCVDVVLKPGQASLHHGHLFHSSGPNLSDVRRMGIAVRYIKPSMKQQTGDRPLVKLVNGEDRFGHFTIVGVPHGRMNEYDFDQCHNDADLKQRTIINGG